MRVDLYIIMLLRSRVLENFKTEVKDGTRGKFTASVALEFICLNKVLYVRSEYRVAEKQ